MRVRDVDILLENWNYPFTEAERINIYNLALEKLNEKKKTSNTTGKKIIVQFEKDERSNIRAKLLANKIKTGKIIPLLNYCQILYAINKGYIQERSRQDNITAQPDGYFTLDGYILHALTRIISRNRCSSYDAMVEYIDLMLRSKGIEISYDAYIERKITEAQRRYWSTGYDGYAYINRVFSNLAAAKSFGLVYDTYIKTHDYYTARETGYDAYVDSGLANVKKGTIELLYDTYPEEGASLGLKKGMRELTYDSYFMSIGTMMTNIIRQREVTYDAYFESRSYLQPIQLTLIERNYDCYMEYQMLGNISKLNELTYDAYIIK